MKPVTWSRRYEIATFLSTPQKRLGLFGLLNLLQDIAWDHGFRLGLGHEEISKRGLLWVLTRQKTVMEKWPMTGEEIELRTWVRPFDGPFANRDFEIFQNGELIGQCTSSFLTIDRNTRRPGRMDFSQTKEYCRADACLPFSAPKIDLQNDLKFLAKFQARNSDLDVNDHVNNTRYAQWILDALPLDVLHKYKAREYMINFLAEMKPGDPVEVSFSKIQDNQFHFQGWRETDQKTVFSARIEVQEVT